PRAILTPLIRSSTVTRPSPRQSPAQVSVQSALQPSPLMGLPSSHCSNSRETAPSRHALSWQACVHTSLSSVLPSSHASPALMKPLPQLGRLHAGSHVVLPATVPASHASPGSTTPLPQVAA